jgi:Putative peptidoglycan binding domain/Putative Ig domain
MNYLYSYGKRVAGVLVMVGLFSAPLAFVYANTSLSIQSLSPSTTVSVGTNVSFTVAASGFSNPNYSISDSFSGSSIGVNNINSSNGVFSWTPTSNDIGTHNLTITVSDANGNSGTIQEQLTVSAAASLSIQSLSPSSSINNGQTLSFTAVTTGFTNPVYTVSDVFNGSTSLSGVDINPSGVFDWTPQTQDAGTHTITVTATDALGHNATAQEQINVNNNPTTVITSISPGSTVTAGEPLSFTVAASGFSSPSYTVSDSFSGSDISNADINSSGNFSWTPVSTQVGVHNIIVYVTDSSGHSTNISQQITVVTPSLVVTSVSPSLQVAPGTTLLMTLSATGFTNPTYSISDSFGGSSVVSGDINSSGVLNWIPTSSDLGSHTFTFSATDSLGHTAQTSITAVVSTNGVAGVTTTSTTSSGLSATQVNAILSLLQSFGADQSTIASVSAALGSSAVTTTSSESAGDGYVFTDFLGMGSSGTEVTELQKRLTSLNVYTGPITGYFGSLTQTAVEKLQGENNISQVGYVGPGTRAVLNAQ